MEKSVVNEIKDIINMNVLNDLLDIDFRGIGKQAMIKRLRKHFLENPEEKDQNKWKVSAEKIWKLYPNALQFKNEKGKKSVDEPARHRMTAARRVVKMARFL